MNPEKKEQKPQAEEFHDMPQVRIDPDDRPDLKQSGHKKLYATIILVIVILAVAALAWSFISDTILAPKPEVKEVEEQPKETKEEEEPEVKEPQDTTAPAFVAFNNHIVVELNALDVDLSKYFLAIDDNKQAQVSVSGNVNLAAEGEYPITVTATDEAGNTTENAATVQVISEDTMATGIEFSCYLDGSIPLEAGTKTRLMANVIYFYYQDVPAEISAKLQELGIDVSGYATATTWHPSMLNTGV